MKVGGGVKALRIADFGLRIERQRHARESPAAQRGKAILPLPSVGEGRGEGGWPPQNFGYLRGGYGLPAVALAKAGDPPRKGGGLGSESGDTCGASR